MIILEPDNAASLTIEQYVARLDAIAKITKDHVWGCFNSVELVASPDDGVDVIWRQFWSVQANPYHEQYLKQRVVRLSEQLRLAQLALSKLRANPPRPLDYTLIEMNPDA